MKILNGGSDTGRLNLILVSEGYRSQDMARFRTHASELVKVIKSEDWYRPGLLNVHRLEVESRQPAHWLKADGKTRDTAFKARFGGDGKVDRLIRGDTAAVRETVQSGFFRGIPGASESLAYHVGVLVNSRRHGGNGGNAGMFWAATGPAWTDTALHEIGHSLFGLCDEYSDDTGTRKVWPERYDEPACPNVTMDPTGRKWQHITDSVCEGAKRYDKGLYRAFERCRMRNPGPFCEVCQDAIVLKLESELDDLTEVEEGPEDDERDDGVLGGNVTISHRDFSAAFPNTDRGVLQAVDFLMNKRLGR